MRKHLLLVALALGSLPAGLQGQEQICDLNAVGRTEGVIEGGVPIILIHDPFTVTCSDGVVLRANSGRLNQNAREVYLFGSVYFEDPERTLTSNEATYNANTEYLHARGDVVFVDRVDGSTLRGPDLEYFRATEQRPDAQMIATQRPTLTISPSDEPGEEPFQLIADRVSTLGDNDLSASGAVAITRSDMDARAEEARYDRVAETLELRQNANVTSEEYDLSAQVIRISMPDGNLDELHALNAAKLTGEDLDVEGTELRLSFEEDVLERAVAIGTRGDSGVQARATSPGFSVEADSLDAQMIEGRLNEVYAIGNARGVSTDTATTVAPDSATVAADSVPELLASDWVSGDTIVGYFAAREGLADTTAATIEPDPATLETQDEPADVELTRLVAIGGAQSLYRIRPEDQPEGERRNLNFLIGERIELDMADGELALARVTGLQYGVYLEATTGADATQSDTLPNAPSAGMDGA